MNFEYDYPIIHSRRSGTPDSQYVHITEDHIIDNSGKVALTEIPCQYQKVAVDGEEIDWYEVVDDDIKKDTYKVDYKNGIVSFYKSHIGKQLTFSYLGTGLTYLSARAIYTERDGLTIKETLQNLTDTTTKARDEAIEANRDVREDEENRKNNELNRISNESARNDSESIRENNEAERQEKESARKINEQNRIEAELLRESHELERQVNEDVRKINESERKVSESTRSSNESNRENNEQGRINSENVRVQNESIREDNESIRQQAESIREQNEDERRTNEDARNSNESLREANEDERMSAESIRESNEDDRALQEVNRESQESIRQANESDRIESENIRQSQEEARQTNTQRVIDEAQSATQNANSAANYAEVQGDQVRGIIDNTRFIEEYNSNTSYSLNNFVRYEGSTYISLQDDNAGNLPSIDFDTEFWALVARRGLDGGGSVDSVNGKTGNVILVAGDVGAETPEGAQNKADLAKQDSNQYTDNKISILKDEKDSDVLKIESNVGDLSQLDTKIKVNLVDAINEERQERVAHFEDYIQDKELIKQYGGMGVRFNDEGLVTTEADMNTLTKTGFYYINRGVNRPVEANGYLIVIAHSEQHCFQQYLRNSANEIYMRHLNLGVWSNWTIVATDQQESWIAPTLVNGWTNYGSPYATAGYMKDTLGFVHLKGFVRGTDSTGETIFSLPEGYRPVAVNSYSPFSYSGASDGGLGYTASRVTIQTEGNVKLTAGGKSWLSLSDIPPFRAFY